MASIMLADGVFNQTVVLILDADEDGALGVILNEISQTPLDAVLPEWVSTVSEPRLLFHGGPVSPNGAICLASVAADGEEPPGWRPLFEQRRSVAPGHPDRDRLRCIPRSADLCRLRRLGLRASCRPRSLKACGTWSAADYSDVFGDQPLELWRTVLRRQKGELAYFSTWVENPELN